MSLSAGFCTYLYYEHSLLGIQDFKNINKHNYYRVKVWKYLKLKVDGSLLSNILTDMSNLQKVNAFKAVLRKEFEKDIKYF